MLLGIECTSVGSCTGVMKAVLLKDFLSGGVFDDDYDDDDGRKLSPKSPVCEAHIICIIINSHPTIH